MKVCLFVSVIALNLTTALACHVVDDDEPQVGDTGPSSADICLAGVDSLSDLHCEPPYQPQFFQGGDMSTVINLDDPSVGVNVGGGMIVHFGAGADWVGVNVTTNGDCAFGCFAVAACGPGSYGCFADTMPNDCFYCGPAITADDCSDFIAACTGTAADTSGGEVDGSGGSDGAGGADDTGGADTSGGADDTAGVEEATWDCATWDPSKAGRLTAADASTFVVPQAVIDDLVNSSLATLGICDETKFSRKDGSSEWRVSAMHPKGLLARLDVRVGDVIERWNGAPLENSDVISLLAVDFFDAHGAPKQFTASHPGFTVQIRRTVRTTTQTIIKKIVVR